MNGAPNGKFFFGPALLGPGEGSEGQISFNFINKVNFKDFYPPTKSRDIVLALSMRTSVRPFHPSALFVCPEPYLSTCWSDLFHSWHE